ncbi:DUF2244 domain-containing protein [Afifella pfennigii]|uniref:DUF2244 domain-containing protein n=1 Tax=Afifella pfennigii TaxID=209897 RepID=UPI00068A5CB8|nr:DUF2244 domain-containing protein [Afifella pfennigii]
MSESHLPPVTAAEPTIFSATLTPHRSLGTGGYSVLMSVFGAICLFSAFLFWRLGAWPIAGIFGLDFVIVWFAFRLSYRSARAFEKVAVSRSVLLIRKVAANGRDLELRLNPYWTRLEVLREEDEGVVGLKAVSRETEVPIGDFLNPEDRASFARALAAALAEARRPPVLAAAG